jgi:prephenate dehydratase
MKSGTRSLLLSFLMKIGFLGPYGTYSHQAAIQKFEHQELISYSTIQKTLDSLHSETTDVVVIPFENSTFGLVQQTVDYFRELEAQFLIYDQIFLGIHHCILSRSSLDEIRRIYSHPQVFGVYPGFRTMF